MPASISQIVILVFTVIAPAIINAVVPAGALHDTILNAVAAIGALLMVLFRKPSDQGGTVATRKEG